MVEKTIKAITVIGKINSGIVELLIIFDLKLLAIMFFEIKILKGRYS